MSAPFEDEVSRYLRDCAGHPELDRRYHPTADGAVKVVWHHSADEAAEIRSAFAALTTGTVTPPRPTPAAEKQLEA